MAYTLSNLSLAQLKRAVEIKEQIDSLENQLSQLVRGSAAPSPRKTGRRPTKRIWTDAMRARNAAYQRARRARLKAAMR